MLSYEHAGGPVTIVVPMFDIYSAQVSFPREDYVVLETNYGWGNSYQNLTKIGSVTGRPDLRLRDPDGDGTYSLTLDEPVTGRWLARPLVIGAQGETERSKVDFVDFTSSQGWPVTFDYDTGSQTLTVSTDGGTIVDDHAFVAFALDDSTIAFPAHLAPIPAPGTLDSRSGQYTFLTNIRWFTDLLVRPTPFTEIDHPYWGVGPKYDGAWGRTPMTAGARGGFSADDLARFPELVDYVPLSLPEDERLDPWSGGDYPLYGVRRADGLRLLGQVGVNVEAARHQESAWTGQAVWQGSPYYQHGLSRSPDGTMMFAGFAAGGVAENASAVDLLLWSADGGLTRLEAPRSGEYYFATEFSTRLDWKSYAFEVVVPDAQGHERRYLMSGTSDPSLPQCDVTTGIPDGWHPNPGRTCPPAPSPNVRVLHRGPGDGAADFFVPASADAYLGDWDGDGVDTLAWREGNLFTFTSTNADGGGTVTTMRYGRAGEIVLVGDWNGDGRDTIAIRRGTDLHLRDDVLGGNATLVVAAGKKDDELFAGDFDGDGRDTIAIRRGASLHVSNDLRTGAIAERTSVGRGSDRILVGDVDGNGSDEFLVHRGTTVLLDPADKKTDEASVVHLAPSEIPLVGRWAAGAADEVGALRP